MLVRFNLKPGPGYQGLNIPNFGIQDVIKTSKIVKRQLMTTLNFLSSKMKVYYFSKFDGVVLKSSLQELSAKTALDCASRLD